MKNIKVIQGDVWKVMVIFDNEQITHTSFCRRTCGLDAMT